MPNPLEQENLHLRRAAEYIKFLYDAASFLSKLESPTCFISYAWEDNETEAGKASNAVWHMRLSRLKHDLEILGARVFLDIYDMHGDMRTQMQKNIAKSDIVFLIGTPRLKSRLSQIPLTNVAFEYEEIKKKVAQNNDCLLPLWFEGAEFNAAFPAEVQRDLVRDMRDIDAHNVILARIANPMGIIPDIFKLHQRSATDSVRQQYRLCWEKLETALQLIDVTGRSPTPYLPATHRAENTAPVPSCVSEITLADNEAIILFDKAKVNEKTGQHQVAFDLYLAAANRGYPKAQANVGSYLLQGIGGISVDKTTAYHWLLKAAQQGEPRAQYNLARMWEKGDGIKPDYIQAKYWYEQAAQGEDEKTAEKAKNKLTEIFKSPQKFRDLIPS